MAAGLRRLIAELRAVSSPRDVDAALARLHVRVMGDELAIIAADGAEASGGLDALGARSVAVVSLARDVYARVPTSEGRVRLLVLAARAARERVELHALVSDEKSHLGRLAIDAPRRILRAAGLPAAEPGDRFGPDRFAHCFFDEEMLHDEVRRAGLVLSARRGFLFTLRRADASEERAAPERAEPFAMELARVVRHVREVDESRKQATPQRVVDELRARGANAKERGPVGRARLRRAIGWVDAALPGGANCYRRVLLELALDAGAARETVVFGLDVGSTGHVAFEDREERTFDVAFAIPAPRPR
ncbi:MAG: hypothetical protein JWO86_5005 [Myxococcaceae bacterium]|nr:hypothetical protein [Myxococcaceae bacterium]